MSKTNELWNRWKRCKKRTEEVKTADRWIIIGNDTWTVWDNVVETRHFALSKIPCVQHNLFCLVCAGTPVIRGSVHVFASDTVPSSCHAHRLQPHRPPGGLALGFVTFGNFTESVTMCCCCCLCNVVWTITNHDAFMWNVSGFCEGGG